MYSALANCLLHQISSRQTRIRGTWNSSWAHELLEGPLRCNTYPAVPLDQIEPLAARAPGNRESANFSPTVKWPAMTMHVHVETVLPCPVEAAWAQVCRSDLLAEVAWPLVTFDAVDGPSLPSTWPPGETVRLKSKLFGLVPLGTRSLFFERIDSRQQELQTRENDRIVRRWDHLIALREDGAGGTRYSDTVILDAGWWTILVWLFAQCFYRYRQRRWLRVARRITATPRGKSQV